MPVLTHILVCMYLSAKGHCKDYTAQQHYLIEVIEAYDMIEYEISNNYRERYALLKQEDNLICIAP